MADLLSMIAMFLAVPQAEVARDRTQQTDCALCAREIDLDPARWSCLLRKQGELAAEVGGRVMIQLDAATCNSVAATGKRADTSSRSGTAQQPVVDDPGGTPVMILSKAQLACIAAHAAQVKASNGRVRFDLSDKCR